MNGIFHIKLHGLLKVLFTSVQYKRTTKNLQWNVYSNENLSMNSANDLIPGMTDI